MPQISASWLLCPLFLAGIAPCGQSVAATSDFQAYAWRNVAVHGGGYVSGLVFHPAELNLLYARTDVGGAYRWDGDRHAWIPLTDALDRANGTSELYGVLSLALDPRDPEKVYLACGEYTADWARSGAVLRSSDRGRTWEVADLPFKLGGNQDGRGIGERLAVDPRDSRVLFLGTTRDGLWKSLDGGKTWASVRGLPSTIGVGCVLFGQGSGEAGRPTSDVYAGLMGAGQPALMRSRDGGTTWSAIAGIPAGWLVHHAAFGGDTLYVALGNGLGPNNLTDGGVWKWSPDAGRWTEITPVRPRGDDLFGYAGLSVDPHHPGTVFVSTLDRWVHRDEIFRTTDGGVSWTPLLHGSTLSDAGTPYVAQLKPHWISEVALDPFFPERLWFVTGYGVWATDKAEANTVERNPIVWSFADRGLEETVIDELISPPAGVPLLSGMGDLGGFRHEDLSQSPRPGMFQPHASDNPGLAFAANAPLRIVRTHFGPARGSVSSDGGVTWRDFASTPEPARTYGPGIAAIAADGHRIVWLPKGSKPFYSDDDGATWRESRTSLVETTQWETYGPVADPVNPRRFYVYDHMDGGVYVSADGGESFVRTANLPALGGHLRAEPGAEGSLWEPTASGLEVSEDGGHHFRKVEGVEAAYEVGFGAPGPGATRPTLFLDGVVAGRSAFFRSDDRGAAWTRIADARLRLGYVRAITGDPRVYGRIYVGTSGRGILVGEPAAR